MEEREIYVPGETGKLDLLIVSDYPAGIECIQGRPVSDVMRPVRNLAKTHGAGMEIGYVFAVNFDVDEGKRVCTMADINGCKKALHEHVKKTEPAALLLLGSTPCVAFGIEAQKGKSRGRIFSLEVEGHPVKAVVTHGARAVYKAPGLFGLLEKDYRKAVFLSKGGIYEKPDLTLDIPLKFKDVMASIAGAQAVIDDRLQKTGKRTCIAVDTETTSLEPHKNGERVIAISVSVKKDHGLAFCLDHREAAYSDEQKQGILQAFLELINPEKVVTCAANGKFDYKWLAYRYGLDMCDFGFDVLLLEHVLAEDKKGEYNLKSITNDYFPGIGGYEDAMDTALAKAQREINEAHDKQNDDALGHYLDEWFALGDGEREELLTGWVTKGYVPFSKISELCRVKTVKQKGGKRPSASYVKSLWKILRVAGEHGEIEGYVQGGAREKTYEDVPVVEMLHYAAIDAAVTRNIFGLQREALFSYEEQSRKLGIPSPLQSYIRYTRPLSVKIAEMEYSGIRIDREKALEYKGRVNEGLAMYEERLFSEIGRRINLSAGSKELVSVLFREMKFKPKGFTAAGQPSVNEEALKKLYDDNDTELFKNLVAHRKIQKAGNTYIDRWLEKSAWDGKIHFSLHQNGTKTFRLSSSKPSLQNVPFYLNELDMNLKALFIPDTDEYEFYDLDISNAEMRVLCAYSEDEKLIAAFNEGMDIHSLTASTLSDFSYDNIMTHKEDKVSEQYTARQLGKKINFGTVYSVTAKGLKRQLWSDMRIKVTEEEAQGYLDKFFKMYPGIKAYMENTRAQVKRYNFVHTLTGRLRRFPLAAFSRWHLTKACREGINARIQGTSADIMNTNLVDLADLIKPLGGRVVLTVHDSILFQLPKGTVGVDGLLEGVFSTLTREKFPWLPVEWKYDYGKGPNYGACG